MNNISKAYKKVKVVDDFSLSIEKGHICFIKRILHGSGDYMHAFVLCNEAVFDPTSKPSFWNYDLQEYLRIMERSGFKVDEMF